MSEKDDFYHELREKIRKWAASKEGEESKWTEYVLSVPDFFHLICKLAIDPDVSTKAKAKLAGTIVYFVSPIDLIPEGIVGPVGYLDDLGLTAYVLNGIVNEHPESVKKHWAGDGDVIELIQEILKVADEMIGSGLWAKLKGIVD